MLRSTRQDAEKRGGDEKKSGWTLKKHRSLCSCPEKEEERCVVLDTCEAQHSTKNGVAGHNASCFATSDI